MREAYWLLRHGRDRLKPKPNFPEEYMAEVRRKQMTPEGVVGELMTLGVETQFVRLAGHICFIGHEWKNILVRNEYNMGDGGQVVDSLTVPTETMAFGVNNALSLDDREAGRHKGPGVWILPLPLADKNYSSFRSPIKKGIGRALFLTVQEDQFLRIRELVIRFL